MQQAQVIASLAASDKWIQNTQNGRCLFGRTDAIKMADYNWNVGSVKQAISIMLPAAHSYVGLTKQKVAARFSVDTDPHRSAKVVCFFQILFHGNTTVDTKKKCLQELENHYTGLENKIASGYSPDEDDQIFYLYFILF